MAHQPIQLLPLGDRTDTSGKTVKNRILLSIPDNEFRSIRSHLQFVDLPHHTTLHQPHEVLEFAHFLNDGLVSLVVVFTGGKTVEAGIVGREGFVGIPAVVGLPRSPLLEIVQISGSAYRISTASLRDLLRSAPELRSLLERHAVLLGLQVAQTAACNRLHGIEQRLARWLLMAQDRVDSDVLPITHDFLATMLGTDRPSVTLAAGILQKHQIIEYNRGSVRILNRAELEKAACECYGIIQQYSDTDQQLSPGLTQ